MSIKKFNVIIKEEKIPKLQIIANIISEFNGITNYEAIQKANKISGFIGEGLSEEDAKKLISICEKNRISTIKIPEDEMPKIKNPININSIIINPEKIEFNGEIHLSCNKEDIVIITYIPLKYIQSKQIISREGPSATQKIIRLGIMATTGIPIGLGKNKEIKKEIKNTEITLYMDIILKDETHLRMNSDHFDFSFLKDEKTYSSQINFKIMSKKIALICPKALKNPALYDLIENKISNIQYETFSEIEKEILRLLIIHQSII